MVRSSNQSWHDRPSPDGWIFVVGSTAAKVMAVVETSTCLSCCRSFMASSFSRSGSFSSTRAGGGLMGRRRGKKPTTTAAIVVALILAGYTALRPSINRATGWNLPAVGQQADVAPADRTATSERGRDANPAGGGDRPPAAIPTSASRAEAPSSGPESPNEGATRPPATRSGSSFTQDRNSSSTTRDAVAVSLGTSDPSLKFGLLREMQPDRFISPAGLLYTPGSAEGHRLKHLERHTVDQPGRPGKHGVFDGGMGKALSVIDQAYTKAKANVRTTKSTDQGRIVYTVDMGKRIGFIGGRDGNQRRKPMARRVRLILDGNRVITAYPM